MEVQRTAADFARECAHVTSTNSFICKDTPREKLLAAEKVYTYQADCRLGMLFNDPHLYVFNGEQWDVMAGFSGEPCMHPVEDENGPTLPTRQFRFLCPGATALDRPRTANPLVG